MKFKITCFYEQSETFEVEADSREEAFDKVNSGELEPTHTSSKRFVDQECTDPT